MLYWDYTTTTKGYTMDSNEPLHQDESEFIFSACAEDENDYFPQVALHTYFPRGLAIASVEECIYCATSHEQSWDYSPNA